eukprot:6291122-Amphidinium_carterae.1
MHTCAFAAVAETVLACGATISRLTLTFRIVRADALIAGNATVHALAAHHHQVLLLPDADGENRLAPQQHMPRMGLQARADPLRCGKFFSGIGGGGTAACTCRHTKNGFHGGMMEEGGAPKDLSTSTLWGSLGGDGLLPMWHDS